MSLEQNVTQAKQLFKPFYEDNYLMKDMAWTKNYINQRNKAATLQNSKDEKQRAMYWDTGIKDLDYSREEFKEATDICFSITISFSILQDTLHSLSLV